MARYRVRPAMGCAAPMRWAKKWALTRLKECAFFKIARFRLLGQRWPVRGIRPRSIEEAVRRFETPAGFQDQVDYATFNLPWCWATRRRWS
jgi:hypothetical protein